MLVLRRLDATAPGFDRELAALTAFESTQDAEVDATVARIVADVQARGDAALLEYTVEFDRVEASSVAALEITADEMQRAWTALPEATRAALQTAAQRIRAYHERQKLASWSYSDSDGSEFGQRVTPTRCAAASTSGLRAPSGVGTTITISATPATCAGMAFISTDEGYAALPPGT